MFKNRLIFLFVLICLLTALAPLSDFDHDGDLDSLISEGFILIPLIGSVTGLFSLWTRLPVACFTVSQQFSTLLVPPPISN
jgi:hypothetical protein